MCSVFGFFRCAVINLHLTDNGIPFVLQRFCLNAEPKVKKIESDFVTAKVRTACTMSCTLEHQPKYLSLNKQVVFRSGGCHWVHVRMLVDFNFTCRYMYIGMAHKS